MMYLEMVNFLSMEVKALMDAAQAQCQVLKRRVQIILKH
jgi:hypothetical protein